MPHNFPYLILLPGLTLLFAAAISASPVRLELTASPDRQVSARPALYGHNMTSIDWHGTTAPRFGRERPPILWDTQADQPDPAWKDLTHAWPLRVMRFHTGNNYAWRDVIGPREQRKPIKASEAWAPPYRTEAGLDEFLRWLETLPGHPEASLIASPFLPAADLADLVAYCNATTGPMAELRAANGHPEPYRVRYWELGNETDWIGRADLDVMRSDSEQEKQGKLLVSEYVARCAERIAAMRAVDPSILIYAHAQTAPWPSKTPRWRAWHREVLRHLGPDIDGIVIHLYYDGYAIPYVLASLDSLIADIRELQPADRAAERPITVVVNEHARWVPPSQSKQWVDAWSLQSAISTTDFLLRLMARPEVSMANYWCYLHRGPWRVLDADWDRLSDETPGVTLRFGTAIQPVFQLLNDALLPRYELLTPVASPNETSLAEGNYDQAVTAGLFSDPVTGEYALVAVNRSSSDPATLSLTIPQNFRSDATLRRSLITADSLSARNTPTEPFAVALNQSDLAAASLPRDASRPDAVLFEVPPQGIVSWRWR